MDVRFHLCVAFSLLLILSLSGCGGENGGIGGSGLLEADEAVISAETAGRVESLRFVEGALVNRGETLLVIDPSRHELELESALAGYHAAQTQLKTARVQLSQAQEAERYAKAERDRVSGLMESGTATQQQLDRLAHEAVAADLARQSAQARINTTEAELAKIEADINSIKRHLEDCYPVAPLTGIITEKYIDAGELLAPGKPMAKISHLDTLWVKVYLPAGDFARVTVGESATVDTESGDARFPGRVVWTSEEAEFTPKNVQTEKSRSNLVYAVKVRVANSDGSLKIGMPVFVTFER